MLTWLRIIVSCFCLVLCVLFAAIWVQSYRSCMVAILARADYPPPILQIWGTYCSRGLIQVHYDPKHSSPKTKWILDIVPGSTDLQLVSLQTQYLTTWKGMFGFGCSVSRFNGQVSRTLTFPIWMPKAVFGFLTILIRPMPRWRFGLHELFVLTTIVAIIASAVVVFLRGVA